MLQEIYLETGPVRLNVACNDATAQPLKPRIVMLHGVLRQWRDFTPILPPLTDALTVQAVDFRGHGGSGRASGYRVIDYVHDAVAVLQQLDQPALLYGHSLGAMVAAMTATRVPDKVCGLILEDPPFDAMGRRISESRLASLFQGMHSALRDHQDVASLSEALARIPLQGPSDDAPVRLGDTRDRAALRFSAACLLKIDPAVLDAIVDEKWLVGYDFEELGKIACPALLLQADPRAGGMLSDADATRFEQLVSPCYRLKIAGAGHLIHWSHRVELMNAVLNFALSIAVTDSPR